MTDDDKALVKRLRAKIDVGSSLLDGLPVNPDGAEAADRIEALTAENERLRALLYPDEMTKEDYEMIYGWGGQG